LLFVLRCVVQAGDGAGKSREKLIRLLPRDVRYFYLSGARLPVSSPKRSRYYDEDAYRYFSSLVGQLRIPAAFEYLNAASWPLQWVAPGMVHDRDGDSIERLVASVGEPNAHYMVSMLLLASSQPQCFESLQGVIRNGDPGTRSRTLASLTAAASLLRQEDASSLAGLVDRWTPLLTDVALHDDHPDARAQAVQFLRALGHKGSRLTPAARDVFKATLSDPSAEMRKRALSALSPPELKDDLGLAWKLLDDPDLAVAFGALFHFYISADLPRFCRATVNLVRRCFAGEPSLLSVAASLREQLPRETGAPLRCIALLLTAARYSPIRGCQLYSVRALHAMRIAWTIPALIGVLWSDVWEEARGFALHAIADLLGPNAEPHILRALEDPSSEVRWRAVAACRSRDEPFRSQAAPVLFRLREDESESVRNLASAVLREYGRVDEPSLLLPLQLRQP
jgi:HEAT repeat protein